MTRKLTRIGMVAIALAMALALVLTACGGEEPAYPAYGEDTTAAYVETTEELYDEPDEDEEECYCDELEDDALCSICEAELDEDEDITETDEDEDEPDEDEDEPDEDEDEDEDTTVAAIPLPQGNAAILAEYAQVMQAIKDRQPSYTSINFQQLANQNELPAEVVTMLNNHFFQGGASSLTPAALIDTRMLVHERDARANPDRRAHARPDGGGRFSGGGMGSSARWIGVSRNDRGSLATMEHVRSISVRDLGNDRRQIDITVADARNPAVIAEGASTAPNSIAAFMEVQDIAEILALLDNALYRTAFRLARINLSQHSYVHYSGSTIRVIYNARTMEAESVYKVGRMRLNFDGAVGGVNTAGHPIRLDAIFDFNSFDWGPAWPPA